MIDLTTEQLDVIRNIAKFIKSNNKLFLLKGYAGTGKTTIMTQLLQNQIYREKKIAMCATTHKAVSVLEMLYPKTGNVNFMTIHKLLKIKRVIGLDGTEQYISQMDSEWKPSNNKSIYNYDIIIIDEASMVSQSLLSQILKLMRNFKGCVIFIGDSAQLPPINEAQSKVFDLDIPKSELKTIMRSNNAISVLSKDVRNLLSIPNHKINIKSYTENGVSVYKQEKRWFDSYILDYHNKRRPIILVYTNKRRDQLNNSIRSKIFKDTTNKYEVNELIVFNNFYKPLTSTDVVYHNSQHIRIQQINEGNIKMKNLDFNEILNLKLKLNANNADGLLEVKDVNISCPICYDEVDFGRETPCHHYFCTGCIITWLEKNRCCPYCRMDIKDNNICIKDNPVLSKLINELRDITLDKSYKVWYLYSDIDIRIVVIHENDEVKYTNDIKEIKELLKQIKLYIDNKCLDKFTITLLNRLWEFYYSYYIDQFADISYGYCITTHKSQGSTFKYVYIDLPNLILNHDITQRYQCLYTAVTRASNHLHILYR